MAILSIKSTYSLDVKTVRALERMARHWKVSKSEALRRAIQAAAEHGAADTNEALEALDELQESLHLSPAKTRQWARAASAEGRAASAGAERRTR